jgi:plastocyanin
VPAGRPLRIRIANDDPAVQHNLAIYDADPERVPAARRLFAGELIVGPASTVYTAPALPAGTYAFRCEVHSTTMRGVLLAV